MQLTIINFLNLLMNSFNKKDVISFSKKKSKLHRKTVNEITFID